MSTLFHCFLIGRKHLLYTIFYSRIIRLKSSDNTLSEIFILPQAEKSQGWLWWCGGFCGATREALDFFGAVATFA